MTLLEAFNHIKYFADNYCRGSISAAEEQMFAAYDHITEDSKEALALYIEWKERMITWKLYISNDKE